jgi:hypothetical protein
MANGGVISGKSFQSFAVNETLVRKVVEAIQAGEKSSRSSGDISSFEVFIRGFRQNLVVGQIMVIPPSVADSLETFPVSLLYGAMIEELSPEANADILSYKLGESEYDEYKDSDLSAIKDKLFKDGEGKFCSVIVFVPAWGNPKNYVIFKYVKDEVLLAMFVRHQVFASYFNPSLSSAFDQILTEVDTSRIDVTDITPKLTMPWLAENPFKSYPDLQDPDKIDVKIASAKTPAERYASTPKIFLAKGLTDDFTAEFLEPGEKKVLNNLSDDIKKGVEGEITKGEDLRTTSDNEGLRNRPDYGSPESHSSDMNRKNSGKNEEHLVTMKHVGEKGEHSDVASEKGVYCSKCNGKFLKTKQEAGKTAADRIQTYPAWKRRVKQLYPEAVFEGDIDIAQAFKDATKDQGVGEWEGSYGEVDKDYVAKKADGIAGIEDTNTSQTGQDVDNVIGVIPAVLESAVAVAASKKATSDATFDWAVKPTEDGRYAWAIRKKVMGIPKTVAKGTADNMQAANSQCKNKLTELRGVPSEPKGNDPRMASKKAFHGVKVAEMDSWISAGLGLTTDGIDFTASKQAATQPGFEPLVQVDGFSFGKDRGSLRGRSDAVKYLVYDDATSEVVDHPAFDGARIVYDNPAELPSGFRTAVDHYFKGLAKQAKKFKSAEVATDIDDIWKETMEDFGPAPEAEIEEPNKDDLIGKVETPKQEAGTDEPNPKQEYNKDKSLNPENEGSKQIDGKKETELTETPKPKEDAPKSEPSEPSEKKEESKAEEKEEDSSAKPFEKKEAGKVSDAVKAVACPKCSSAKGEQCTGTAKVGNMHKDRMEAYKKLPAKQAKSLCEYCGRPTNNVLGMCDECEDSLECDICHKGLNGGSDCDEIRPGIFVHDVCVKESAKTAAFNYFIPGQVAEEFYPELLHETVQYPSESYSPMIQDVDLAPGPGYISTSPAGGLGIGAEGKPQVLEGAPLRRPENIRGPMYSDEYYSYNEGLDGGTIKAASFEDFKAAFAELSDPKTPKSASVVQVINKRAGKEENKAQFIDFLKKVMGEVAVAFVAAFKATSRGILSEVPGLGEINLGTVEAPSNNQFNTINTGSRVKFLLDKMNDTDLQDALNEAWAQASVMNNSPNGGFVYEVFVRGQAIDVDSMILSYEYVIGSKGV